MHVGQQQQTDCEVTGERPADVREDEFERRAVLQPVGEQVEVTVHHFVVRAVRQVQRAVRDRIEPDRDEGSRGVDRVGSGAGVEEDPVAPGGGALLGVGVVVDRVRDQFVGGRESYLCLAEARDLLCPDLSSQLIAL